MIRSVIAAGVAVLATGCASITTDSTQMVRVDALDEQGVAVNDAKCDLTNDNGTYSVESGRYVVVRKSGKNLNIRCESPTREDLAEGTAISRPGAGMFGNIIFGGGIGAIIDHSSGKAYNYPEWMQVVFGRILTFDRTEHEDGVPMAGKEAVSSDQPQTKVVRSQ